MEQILAIAGKAGLYRTVRSAKNMLIVEALDGTHLRRPAFPTEKIMVLNDIMVYTTGGEVPLWQVLDAVAEHEQHAASSLDYKKCDGATLHEYFSSVLPDYDKERVHDSDMRRLVQWYNILLAAGYSNFRALLAGDDKG